MTRSQRLQDDEESPDYQPRAVAPWPAQHMPPFAIITDGGAGTMLLTPFPKRSTGLTWDQRLVVDHVLDHLNQTDCRTEGWLDPNTLTLSPFRFPADWIRRRLADCAAVALPEDQGV